MDNEGIFTLDFLLTFLVIIVICGGLVQVTLTRLDTANNINTITEARQQSEIVASTINTVISNPNQTIIIKLPEKIGDYSYKLYADHNELFLEVNGMKEKTSFYPTRINGEYESRVIFQPNKSYKIFSNKNNLGNIQIIEITEQ